MRFFMIVTVAAAFLLLSVSCNGSATSHKTDKDNAANDENQTDSENDSDGLLNDESAADDNSVKPDETNDSENPDESTDSEDPDIEGDLDISIDEDMPVICEAEVKSCRENVVIQCNNAGTVISEIETCTGVGVSCYKGECLDECGIAAKNQGYLGCEYWGAFLQQTTEINSATYALVVANPNATEINVKVFSVGDELLAEHDIEAGELYSFELGTDRRIQGPGISDLAFKLVSTRPVAVTQMNPFGNVMMYSNDATLLFQKGALGTEYYAMSWPSWSTMSGFVSIVAVEDGTTTVTVNYSAATIAGTGIEAQAGGDEVEYSLTKYQILTLNSSLTGTTETIYGADLTGSFIKSDKKVAVFGGHVCARIPADKTACDHLEHQIFPLQSWGKKFTAVRTKPRGTELDHYRILASEKGASVAWIGGVSGSVNLSAGEFHDMSTDKDFVINSSEPVMIGQFLASQDAGAGTGDPSMMLIAPDEQLRREYVFLVPPNYDYNRITIVASADTDITVNETSYSSNSFVAIEGTDRLRQWVDLETGPYTLEASKPVAVYVYGFSQYVSYAYTAGLDLTTINPVGE
ncbi:MAG TPA: hypothetical protein PKG52_02350 [bacterium]|nr:hypothetical protein [bacterium]